MAKFEYPTGINPNDKSNEQNIQYTKSYLINMIDSLTYQMNQLESELRAEIQTLSQRISELGG